MPTGTVFQKMLACNFGPLYTVLVHNCDNSNPEQCHPELIARDSNPTRVQRVREVRGITAAQLRGTTLFVAVNATFATWDDVYAEVDAAMRSS